MDGNMFDGAWKVVEFFLILGVIAALTGLVFLGIALYRFGGFIFNLVF